MELKSSRLRKWKIGKRSDRFERNIMSKEKYDRNREKEGVENKEEIT